MVAMAVVVAAVVAIMKRMNVNTRGRIMMRDAASAIALGVGLCAVLASCKGAPQVVTAPPEVSVSQPIEREVSEYFETTGRTDAVESVDIRARVSGYLVKVNFVDGSEVKQGDELFVIDPRPYEAEVLRAEGDVARWEAALRKALADVARNQRLLPTGAASERELETSIAARDSAQAEIKAAGARLQQATLDLEFTRVTAPIAGRVSRTNVTVGNLIQEASAQTGVLTGLVSVDPIYAYFDIDEHTMLYTQERRRASGKEARLSDLKPFQIPVEVGLANEEGHAHRGILDFVDNRVDPNTGTIKARGVFDNGDRSLTPGLFVRVRMPLSQPRPSLLVTERAIGTDQGNKFVYVVSDKNVVEYRPAKLGPRSEDGLRAITQGINAGEWVIVNGVQRARPGITVTPQRVGMVPPAPGPAGSAKAAGAPAAEASGH